LNIIIKAALAIALNIVVGVTTLSAASLSLVSGEWVLASIPGDSGSTSIGEIFVSESLLEAQYTSNWVVFRYDASANAGAGAYSSVPLNGSVKAGEGFWILQNTGSDVTVDLPELSMPALSEPGDGCSSSDGCYIANLQSQSASESWSMVGLIKNTASNMNEVGFVQEQAALGCVEGCTTEQALNSEAFGQLWRYDSASKKYTAVDATSEILPGQGFWVRTGTGVQNASMLIPAVNDDDDTLTAEENLALIKANATRNTQFDNNAFYDVPASDITVPDLTYDYDAYNEALLDTSHSGYFRVKCEVSHFAYDDPIVFPNQPGRAHLHMFFGNTNAHAYSTFDSLLNTGTGTCNGEDLNRTAYWVPALLDNQGNALIPDQIMVYYKNDHFRLNGANELVSPFPDNLRMISGNGAAQSPQDGFTGDWESQPVISFSCGPAYRSNDRRQALIPDCSGSDQLEMQIAFPQCVNEAAGYQSDQSHISYSENGYYGVACPDSHPTDISSIMYRIFFRPDEYGGSLTDLHLSSDVKMDKILPGENCNNTQADCETGLLGRDPAISLVPRKRDFYASGYRAPASELIKLCPGKTFNPADPLRSVAMCRMN